MNEHASIRVAGAEEAPDLPDGSITDMNRKLNAFLDSRGLREPPPPGALTARTP